VSAFLMDVERGLPPTLGYLPRGKGVINGIIPPHVHHA
jgi:hypothetical protein